VFFFGIPALFFVVVHALVLGGVITPPANMQAYFGDLDPVTLAINGGEALFLIFVMSTLWAMMKVALPLSAVYFAIDIIHNLSGKYLAEPATARDLVVNVVIGVASLAYVWRLKRKGLLH
jgi:hypothetical protein